MSGGTSARPRGLLPGLAVTETVSWGICYYGFAVLLPPMERDLGWSRATLVGAFTIAVIVSGLAAFPVGRWLDRPVEHVRDVRTELLVKLALRDRAGLDRVPLLAAQRDRFAPTLAALTTPRPDDDLVDVWRRESARAVDRFLR